MMGRSEARGGEDVGREASDCACVELWTAFVWVSRGTDKQRKKERMDTNTSRSLLYSFCYFLGGCEITTNVHKRCNESCKATRTNGPMQKLQSIESPCLHSPSRIPPQQSASCGGCCCYCNQRRLLLHLTKQKRKLVLRSDTPSPSSRLPWVAWT